MEKSHRVKVNERSLSNSFFNRITELLIISSDYCTWQIRPIVVTYRGRINGLKNLIIFFIYLIYLFNN